VSLRDENTMNPLQPSYAPPNVPGIASDSENLPEFWEIKHTIEGRKYYVNHADKSTHWSLPASSITK